MTKPNKSNTDKPSSTPKQEKRSFNIKSGDTPSLNFETRMDTSTPEPTKPAPKKSD